MLRISTRVCGERRKISRVAERAVHAGQVEIQHHDVGVGGVYNFVCISSVASFAHDRKVGLRSKNAADACSEQRMIVDECDTQWPLPSYLVLVGVCVRRLGSETEACEVRITPDRRSALSLLTPLAGQRLQIPRFRVVTDDFPWLGSGRFRAADPCPRAARGARRSTCRRQIADQQRRLVGHRRWPALAAQASNTQNEWPLARRARRMTSSQRADQRQARRRGRTPPRAADCGLCLTGDEAAVGGEHPRAAVLA